MSLHELLFPNHDEVMCRQKEQQAAGLDYIKAHGFDIGDTVYLDGHIVGTIENAQIGFGPWDLMPSTPFVTVSLPGKAAAEYTGIERYRSSLKINFQCRLVDFTKEPSE